MSKSKRDGIVKPYMIAFTYLENHRFPEYTTGGPYAVFTTHSRIEKAVEKLKACLLMASGDKESKYYRSHYFHNFYESKAVDYPNEYVPDDLDKWLGLVSDKEPH